MTTYNDVTILQKFIGKNKDEDVFILLWEKMLDYESFGVAEIRETEKYKNTMDNLYRLMKNKLIIYSFPELLEKYVEYEANEKLRLEQLKIQQFHDSGLGAIFEKHNLQYSESLVEELNQWASANYSDY